MSKAPQRGRDSSVALEGIQKQNKLLTEDPRDAPEADNVQISQDVAKKLERMRSINAAI
jgi:hypothetical protein